ncbi:MAG: septum formation initiator family protein [Candidatus Firestonebacteria bacterium]
MKTIVVLLISALLYIGLNVECIKTGYEINKLKFKKIELTNENKILRIEIAKLKSLERIETVAREELGLVTPDKFETITLFEDKEEISFWDKVKCIFKKIISSILRLL